MNDNTKEMLDKMVASGYDYEQIVKPNSTNLFIKIGLIEAIFNVVVRNTSLNSKVTEEKIFGMRESLAEFEDATEIVMTEYKNGNTINEKIFKYSTFMSEYDINGWTIMTINLITEFVKNNIWFEDVIGNGFCCKGKNGNHFRIVHN